LSLFFLWLIVSYEVAEAKKRQKNSSIDDCRLANQFLVNKFGAKLSTARRQGIYDDVAAVVVVKLLLSWPSCFWPQPFSLLFV